MHLVGFIIRKKDSYVNYIIFVSKYLDLIRSSSDQ